MKDIGTQHDEIIIITNCWLSQKQTTYSLLYVISAQLFVSITNHKTGVESTFQISRLHLYYLICLLFSRWASLEFILSDFVFISRFTVLRHFCLLFSRYQATLEFTLSGFVLKLGMTSQLQGTRIPDGFRKVPLKWVEPGQIYERGKIRQKYF